MRVAEGFDLDFNFVNFSLLLLPVILVTFWETYMFGRPMNQQIKIVLLIRCAQLSSYAVRFIGRTRNVHFSSIGFEKLLQPPPRMIA